MPMNVVKESCEIFLKEDELCVVHEDLSSFSIQETRFPYIIIMTVHDLLQCMRYLVWTLIALRLPSPSET